MRGVEGFGGDGTEDEEGFVVVIVVDAAAAAAVLKMEGDCGTEGRS